VRDFSTANTIEDVSVVRRKRMTEDEQRGSVLGLSLARTGKALEIVMQIALYGSYEGKSPYLDVLSGRESDDLAEEKYEFEFLDKEGFELWHEQIRAGTPAPDASQKDEPQYLVKVAELFAAGVRGRDALAKAIKQQVPLGEDDEGRLSDGEMLRAIIDRDLLDYRRFRTFLKDRSRKIVDVVAKRLNVSGGEFGESA
jgi:hypothetical protein